MSSRSLGRRLGGASLLVVLVSVSVLVLGVGLAWADLSLTFYDVIETDQWDTWAPGPSGITQFVGNTMLVVDSDRNNFAEYDDDGIDIWRINLDGTVVDQWGTGFESGTGEPTGVDYDPANNRLFITNDDGEYFIFLPGSDDQFGTPDDPGSGPGIAVSGSDDTEDPAFDAANNTLYVLNGGSNGRIYVLNPTTGQALRSPISLASFAQPDWEGLTLTPTGELLVGSNMTRRIYVIDPATGNPVQPFLSPPSGGSSTLQRISGLAISTPGAGGGAYDIWIADRQDTQNNDDPANIDGRVWRYSTDGTPPTTTTTEGTITTTQGTTTTTQGTTTTTQGTTTTTQGTTTTTQGTTTTTLPGSTTTTTMPGGGGGGGGGGGNSNPFTDDDGSVFENSIEWLAAEGITQGCNPPANTRFCPDDFVTRGQMAAFLVRAKGYSAITGDFFTDDEGSVFETAINRLRTAGVTQGCNPPANTRYCPDDLVTRGQMAAFLVRAFGYTSAGAGDYFIDDNTSVFEGAIDRLRAARVTLGCNPPTNNRYCPDDLVTRGQMAAFLKRALGG